MTRSPPSACVRPATSDDADSACTAVRRSIQEICGPDYGHDETVMSTLGLLRQDHYLIRNTSDGGRAYRFKYELMRRWWVINRG